MHFALSSFRSRKGCFPLAPAPVVLRIGPVRARRGTRPAVTGSVVLFLGPQKKRPRECFISEPNLRSQPDGLKFRQRKSGLVARERRSFQLWVQGFRYVFLATDSTQTISPVRNWIMIDPAHLRVFMKSERAMNSSLGTGSRLPQGETAAYWPSSSLLSFFASAVSLRAPDWCCILGSAISHLHFLFSSSLNGHSVCAVTIPEKV